LRANNLRHDWISLGREQCEQLVPTIEVFLVSVVDHPRGGGPIGFYWSDAAVIDGELLEVGKYAHRQFRAPGIASELIGRAYAVANIDRGLLGFDEKAGHPAAGAETIVRCLGMSAHFDGRFVDHFLVRLGVALAVIDIPAQGLEERIEKLLAQLSLVVAAGVVGLAMSLEAFDQFGHDRRCCHTCPLLDHGRQEQLRRTCIVVRPFR